MDIRQIAVTSIQKTHCVRQPEPHFLEKLKKSMAEDGLLYPVLVVGEGPFELVDGLHRLTVAEALGWPSIHAHVVKNLDLHYLMSIASNLRKTLKPSEMVRLILPIYQKEKAAAELRRRAGGKIPAEGRAAEIAAQVFGWKRKELAARIRIVQKGDEDPERFGRFVKQMDKRGRWYRQNECLLAMERELQLEPERLQADQDGLRTIYHGDMLDVVPTLKFNVDAVIFDPPYGIGKVFDTDDGKGWHEPSTPESYWKWFEPRVNAVMEKLRPGGLFICFQSYEYMLQGYLHKWYGQLKPTLFHQCKHIDMKKHQYIVKAIDVAVIGWKPGAARMFPPILNGVNRLNWMYSPQKPSLMAQQHFACKSQDLMERLISFTCPGAIILDPTCGSGSTLWAAEKMGRRWVGVEQSRRYVDLAWKVREELKLKP